MKQCDELVFYYHQLISKPWKSKQIRGKLKHNNGARTFMPYIKNRKDKWALQLAQICNLLQLPLIGLFLHNNFVTRFLFYCFEDFAITIRWNQANDLVLVKQWNPPLLLVGGRRWHLSVICKAKKETLWVWFARSRAKNHSLSGINC